MDTSGSSVDDQAITKLCKELLLWKPTRCRGRIWCLTPETWLAFAFFLMIMGLSLLSTGCFFTIDAYRKNVMKCGVCVLCSGMTILIMLTGRVKNAIYCRLLCTHNSPPKFVGVCISPPIQPEFLSAMLLPEINREWVSVETLPGFERSHANIVHPPTQQATGCENGEESRSKRRRNKKKKFNNSFSELDPASQESNETIARANASQEEEKFRNGDTPSKKKKQDDNKLNVDSGQQSLQESSQPADLIPDGNNLNELNNQVKDKQVRHQKQGGNHLPSSRMYDTIHKDNPSALNKVLEENSSDYNDKDSFPTANRIISKENSDKPAVNFADKPAVNFADKPAVNFITDDQQEILELARSCPEHNCAEDSSEQRNVMPGHLRNSTTEESEKSAEKTSSTNTTSTEIQQVDPKPVPPDFTTSKSKKRNRRRKK